MYILQKKKSKLILPHLYQDGKVPGLDCIYQTAQRFHQSCSHHPEKQFPSSFVTISACFHCFNPSKGPCERIRGTQRGLFRGWVWRCLSVSLPGCGQEQLGAALQGLALAAGTFHRLCSECVCACTHLTCVLLIAQIYFREAWFLITLQLLLLLYLDLSGAVEGRAGLHCVMLHGFGGRLVDSMVKAELAPS